jgi:virginiamycin B lyase
VLVSAKKAGSTVTITVVSDEQGRFRFPRAKLEPGKYTFTIRAVGYDLNGRAAATVAPQRTATANLKLRKAKDLASQLTNSEWLMSMHGTEEQKSTFLSCLGCHTMQRIVHSKHTAAEFTQLLPRMAHYAPMSTPLHPQVRVELARPLNPETVKKQSEFLNTINLSSGSKWSYALKPHPRPKGQATRVIVTEYDLPRPTIEPHDVVLGPDGNAWYSSFGEQFLGKLDPKTAKLTEYPVPQIKPKFPTGNLDLELDAEGNLWMGMMYQASFAKFDRKTEKFEVQTLPPEINTDVTQINMIMPPHPVDGKIWMESNGIAGVHRFDPATKTWETFEPWKGEKGRPHNLYDIAHDSQNNVYITDFNYGHIGKIDAKSGKITLYPTPTPSSNPRRGRVDAEDRFWFAEHRGNKVGVFDPKTERIEEWAVPTPWSTPYDVVLDKNGEAWTGGMASDRIARIDTKTGRSVEYLLPRSTNIRRVFVDNTTLPVTFWVGSNHGASIIKLEPLE